MPNGFHGSREEWTRLTAPLETLDEELDAHALRHAMKLERNVRNWPSRSLRGTTDGVQRLIEIFLSDEQQLAWTFGITAFQDRDQKRYGKAESLLVSVSLTEIKSRLPSLLDEATERVGSWSARDLPFAVNLKPL
jgi:hypothetical protein